MWDHLHLLDFFLDLFCLVDHLGHDLDLFIDLRIYFGMYCQVLVADTNNSLEQRTTGAFALTQTNSFDGATLFYT
jgi:hypothetical protein